MDKIFVCVINNTQIELFGNYTPIQAARKGEALYPVIVPLIFYSSQEKPVILLLCSHCGNVHRIDDCFPNYVEALLAN